MKNCEYRAICNSLIALCQRYNLLPIDTNKLADAIQELTGDELYISKAELIDFLQG